MGETLRRLVGKCLYTLLKVADLCCAGAKKITHGLRICIEEQWSDDDFVAFKIDMKSAFNVVPSQAVVEECP